MKKLTCEMCGSTDMLKEDGMFVCQCCGTKYSVEEAKKLMIEGTVEVQGTVKVDNSSAVDNYLSMAKNAFDANNSTETENYCNKVIELDPKNYEAWFMKGEVVGWKSTLAKSRIPETINAFSYAIEYCPVDLKEGLATKCEEILIKLHMAILSVRLKDFKKNSNQDNLNPIISELSSMMTNSLKFLEKTKVYKKNMSLIIGRYLFSELKVIWDEAYNTFNSEHPSDDKYIKFWNDGNYIMEAFEATLAILDEDPNASCMQIYGKSYPDIKVNNLIVAIYKQLIICLKQRKEACSYEKTYNNGKVSYRLVRCVSEDKKKGIEFLVFDKEQKIKFIEKQSEKIKIMAREKYWEEHPDEKAALDAKLASVESQLKNATERLNAIEGENGAILTKLENERDGAVPSDNDKLTCEKNISEMESEYKGLGLFKGKEKKTLLERINNEKSHLSEIESRIKKEKQELITRIDAQISDVKAKSQPIHQEIADLSKQKDEVNAELTKDR